MKPHYLHTYFNIRIRGKGGYFNGESSLSATRPSPRITSFITLIFLTLLLVPTVVRAEGASLDILVQSGMIENGNPEGESSGTSLLEKLGSNLRFTIDLSSRLSVNDETNDTSTSQFIGFDLHKVFTGPTGDWGTLLGQGYLTRIDNQPDHPHYFEGEDDWEFVFRIFNFNYTGLAGGRFNIRVGHFEIPYGLEKDINTNGTLREFTHERNLGLKTDWGITLNGQLSELQYEIGLSRGTGNEWTSRGDPYVVAGRIGTPPEDEFVFGLSGFYGRVFTPTVVSSVLDRTRFGADFQWHTGLMSLLAEVSIGQDKDDDIVNALVEVDFSSPDETLLIYLQGKLFFRGFITGWDEASATVLGFRLAPDNHWTYSAQWEKNLSTFSGTPHNGMFSFQIRLRF